jgi:hypothetical protein
MKAVLVKILHHNYAIYLQIIHITAALSRFCSTSGNFYHFFDINKNYTKIIVFEKGNRKIDPLQEYRLHSGQLSVVSCQLSALVSSSQRPNSLPW